MNKFYYILCLLLPVLAMTGCSEESLYGNDDEQITLSYKVTLDDEVKSRAIGDGSNVNQLLVGVFQNGTQLIQEEFEVTENKANITLQLLKNQDYQLVFWAQTKDNGVYNTDNLSNITIDYDAFEKTQMEAAQLDAFYATRTVSLENPGENSVILTRPFTQFGIGVYGNDVEKDKITSAEIKIKGGLYTAFKPLADGEKAEYGGDDREYTFKFAELNDKTDTFVISDKEYTLLTTNYFLVPAAVENPRVSGSVSLKDGSGNSVSDFNFTEAPLVLNARVNIGKGLTEVWDGVYVETLPDADSDGIIHIGNTRQLACLIKYGLKGTAESPAKVHLCKDLDMNVTTITRDAKYAMQHVSFDGGGNTLYRLGNALLGDAANVEVKDLTIDGMEVTHSGHVGALVNTLKGSSTFTNVVINNSKVITTNGAAGGMVGYIVRTSEKERSETLAVSFSDCDLVGVTASGTESEGKFVGLLSGYDNGETLAFDADCSADEATTVTDFDSPYKKDNQSVWITAELADTYDGWLGTETYRRGVVTFGGVQLVPKWDGTTTVEPIVENDVKLVCSPYDLATLQGAKPTSVTFKTNIDLGGHNYKPIYSIQTLDGENKTVYNLNVHLEKHDGMGAAFIQSAPTGSKVDVSHMNLTLINADIKNVHNTALYPAYAITSDGGAGNAYGGIFISKANSCKSYTIENIHVKDSKLYAVCKMGGIIGQSVDTKLDMKNCSVDNCTIQNYQPNVPNYYVLGDDSQPWMEKSGLYVNLLQWWYTNGEVGGLIGFLQDYDADIDGCSVTDTKINCIGQENKDVIANVYFSNQFDKNNIWNTNKKVAAKGKTTIAGRHVNQFIGDVVSYRAEGGTNYTVDITNYTVSGNTYNGTSANSTNRYNHQYDKTGDKYGTNADLYCEVVGCAYYIGLDIIIAKIVNWGHLKYCAGTIKFKSEDGTREGEIIEEIGEGEDVNIAWIGGNFKVTDTNILGLKNVKAEYPSEPTRKDPVY